ncbi:MAG: hypothetical protein IH984_14400 [Planctomycetes bacterium]|nr:hypothetical protein [Planctomycetota bacterium]
MKKLWTIISFLSVIHFLAFIMFIGWLWQSDRLNRDRIDEVRALFSMTMPQAKFTAKQADIDAQQKINEQDELAMRDNPPFSSQTSLAINRAHKTQSDQAARNLEDTRKLSLQMIDNERELLDKEKTEFAQMKAAWDKDTIAERKRKADEQFAQTVKIYESLSPKQSKQMLTNLVTAGNIDQAVSYLDAMNPRNAAKILKAFKTPEEMILATQLQEKLRVFGTGAEDSENLDDANSASNP